MLAGIGVACQLGEVADPLDKARTLQSEGKIEESVEALAKLIKAGDRRGEVLFRYGRALSGLGETGRAIWSLDAALDDPEWLRPAASHLASIAFQGGNPDLALRTLKRLEEERTDGMGDDDIDAKVIEARAYMDTRKNYQEALEPLDEILEFDPGNEEALRLKAAAFLGLKQPDEAFSIIRELGQESQTPNGEDPDTTQAEAYWCSIETSFYRESGELEKAQEFVEDCLERFPTYSSLIDEGLAIYRLQNKTEKALELLQSAYALEPQNRGIRFPLVLQLRAMGRASEAEAVLQANLDSLLAQEGIDPAQLANAWVDLAGLLVDQEKFIEGLEAYNKARSLLGPSASPELLFAQAETMILVRHFDDALAIAEETTVDVHKPMIRGRVAFEKGELEQAIDEFNRAALIWPDNAPVRYYLARAAEGLGQFDRAIEEYRQAIRSDQNLDAARARLSRLHLAEDRIAQAKAIMRFAPASAFAATPLDKKLIEVEIQARTGYEANLEQIPYDPNFTPDASLQSVAEALSRGFRTRVGPESAAVALATIEKTTKGPLAANLFRERVENLLAAGMDDEALDLARKAASERPKDAHAQIALARALSKSETKLDESKDLYLRLAQARPQDSDIQAWLGEIAVRQGRTDQAFERFEAALSIEPANENAIVGLAKVLVDQSKTTQANTRLSEFLSLRRPTSGIAALELARGIPDGAEAKAERTTLGLRALRFGGGRPARDFLRGVDPTLVPEEEPAEAEKPASPDAQQPQEAAS